MSLINEKNEQIALDGAIRASGIIGLNWLSNQMGMTTKTKGMKYLKTAAIVVVNEFAIAMAKTKSWYPKV